MIVLATCLLAPAGAAAATLTLAPAAGPPTAAFKLSGTGFRASGIVDVYWDAAHVGFIGTNASGGFSGWATSVPASAKPGVHYVTVRNDGAPGGAQAVFTVRTNWVGFQGGGAQRGFNATENVLSRTTADGLEHEWTAAGAATRVPPVVSAGALYSLDNAGDLRRFDLGTRTRTWQKRLGVPSLQGGSLATGTANVYAFTIAGGVGTLGAYSMATGNLIWKGTFPGAASGGGPVLAGGVVYLTVGNGSRAETLYAFSATCGAGGATCTPLWRANLGTSSQGYPQPAAVGAGKVFARGADELYAFRVGCGTGNAVCSPAWTSAGGAGEHVIGAPAYSNGMVYAGGSTGVMAFDAECPATCDARWIGRAGGAGDRARTPAIANSRLWTVVEDARLAAYDLACGGLAVCEPRCIVDLNGASTNSPVVIANGLAYVRMDEHIYAVPATCSGSTIPEPVWSARTRTISSTPPVVVDGSVYLASPDPVGVLAFSLGPAAG